MDRRQERCRVGKLRGLGSLEEVRAGFSALQDLRSAEAERK